jgi:hypothetical protein
MRYINFAVWLPQNQRYITAGDNNRINSDAGRARSSTSDRRGDSQDAIELPGNRRGRI